MDDDIVGVDQHPISRRHAFDARGAGKLASLSALTSWSEMAAT